MGHRALVAYQRDDGLFNVHFSHKGAHDLELCNDITETTPLGGEADGSEFANAFINGLEKHHDGAVAGELTRPQEPTTVESEPKKTAVTMPEACEYLHTYNRGVESMYVVNREFDVRGFQCLHVGIGPDDYRGAILLSPRWHDGEPIDVRRDQGQFNGVANTVTSLVSDGVLTIDDAIDRLITQTLDRIQNSRDQQVLAHSPGVPEQYYAEYLPAFLKPIGMGRVNGETTVSAFDDYDPWELPENFPNPELAKQSGDNAQFDISTF